MSEWKRKLVELMFPINPKDIRADVALAIKYKNIPERLFKFCRFDEKGYYVENLKNNKVWLSYPENLNDPYDCALTYSTNEIFKHIMKIHLEKIIADIPSPYNQFTDDEIFDTKNSPDIIRKFIEISMSKDKSLEGQDKNKVADILVKVINEEVNKVPKLLDEGSKKATVLTSFTERNDSMIMWSHYSAKHTGFCVEYNFKQLGQKDKTNILLYPILYQDNLTDITPYLLNEDMKTFNNTITLLAAITKSLEWEYEKEWRLLLPFGVSQKEDDWNVPNPNAVYIGSKITPNNEDLIKGIAKDKKIPLYKANIIPDNFGIKFDEINV